MKTGRILLAGAIVAALVILYLLWTAYQSPVSCEPPADDLLIVTDTTICSGTYDNVRDLHGDGLLKIAGSGITLDLEGVQISDPQANGRAISLQPGINGIVIKGGDAGCAISGFDIGIYGPGGLDDLIVSDIEISDSGHIHILLEDEFGPNRRLVFQDISLQGSKSGDDIRCETCSGSIFGRISFRNTRPGIVGSMLALNNGSRNTIENCSFYSRNADGCNAVWLLHSCDSIIQDNEFDLSGRLDGSHIQNKSHRNLFSRNTFMLHNERQHFLWPEYSCEENAFIGNLFQGPGMVLDGSISSAWCRDDGTHNEYNNLFQSGATYSGLDPHMGKCP